MGLFDQQINVVKEFVDTASGASKYLAGSRNPWPYGEGIVLSEETAVELGRPGVLSMWSIMWTQKEVLQDKVTVVGPDIKDASRSLPLAEFIIVQGKFPNHYDAFRDLRDKVFGVRLKGISIRVQPSRKSIWCRVSNDAYHSGFSLVDLGFAIIQSLKEIDSVVGAEVIFVTSSGGDISLLEKVADESRMVVEALIKMYEEENFDCESCDYREVCEVVSELRAIRKRLLKTKA